MKSKILIYDDNCPLCSWYSSLFVKYGLLAPEGRKPFSALDPSLLSAIDLEKGRNEIPLLDTNSGKVSYGIDALLEIMGQRCRFIKITGNLKAVNWLLKKIYKLISYNRKAIVAKKCNAGVIDCSPDFSYRYRMALILICLLFTSLMLFPLFDIVIAPVSRSNLSLPQVQFAYFGLILINCLLAFNFSRTKALEYLGQLSILALLTILLLIPLLFAHHWFIFSEWLSLFFLLTTSIIIFKEYLRRMEFTGMLTANKWIISINLAAMIAFFLFLLS